MRIALIESRDPGELMDAMRYLDDCECPLWIGSQDDREFDASRLNGIAELAGQKSAFDVVWLEGDPEKRIDHLQQLAQLEKPIVVPFPPVASLGEWEQLRSVDQIVVSFPYRAQPYLQSIGDRLHSGELGKPGLLRIHHWTEWREEHEPFSVLHELGAQIDAACWLFGDRPQTLYAVNVPAEGRVKFGLQLHLGFADGGMALLDGLVMDQVQPYSMITLIGSTGAAYADDHHNMNLMLADRTEAIRVEQQQECWRRIWQDVVDQTEGTHLREFDKVADLYRVMDAVERSYREQKVAEWQGDHYELV